MAGYVGILLMALSMSLMKGKLPLCFTALAYISLYTCAYIANDEIN